jgi:hypothetical protein
MLTLNEYKTLIFNMIAFLLLVSLVLAGLLEYKVLTSAPDVLVQQSLFDGINDRIIKTKDNLKSYDTLFSAPNIQDFETTKNQLLVTTGIKNQESTLQLVDLKSKVIKPIKYSNKYVGQIIAGADKFAMLVEDLKEFEGDNIRTYKSKLAMITEQNQQVVDLNPQFLATQVDNIFINPSGSLLVFTGLGDARYLLDLEDTNNITKINNLESGLNLGFINDSQLALTGYSLGSETRIKFADIVNDQSSFTSLNNEKFSQIVIGPDAKDIYYSQNKNVRGSEVKGLKNLKTNYFKFDPQYSFESIKLSPKDLFILFEKQDYDSLSNPNSIYNYSTTKSFAIYNLKIQYLPSQTISGTKAIWVK